MSEASEGTPRRIHPGWLIGGFFALLILAQLGFYAVAFSLPSDAIDVKTTTEGER